MYIPKPHFVWSLRDNTSRHLMRALSCPYRDARSQPKVCQCNTSRGFHSIIACWSGVVKEVAGKLPPPPQGSFVLLRGPTSSWAPLYQPSRAAGQPFFSHPTDLTAAQESKDHSIHGAPVKERKYLGRCRVVDSLGNGLWPLDDYFPP